MDVLTLPGRAGALAGMLGADLGIAGGEMASDYAISVNGSLMNLMAGRGTLGDALNVGAAVAPEFLLGYAAKLGGLSAEEVSAAVRCCFAAGTLVDTDSGLKPIERVRTGERVLSRDETTGVTAYEPVLALVRPHHRRIFELTLEVGGDGARHRVVFRVTDDHPWRTLAGRWTQTVALMPRDQVIRAQGPPARVISVRRTARFESTYNLDVAEFHTYFVGRDRLWVHNACSDLINAAKNLGFKLEKGLGRIHGQDIFKSGNKFISRDADAHIGGQWKMFEMRGGKLVRTGTYNGDLTERLGD